MSRALGSQTQPQGKYHDFACCESTRGVDTLLAHYTQDRERILQLMRENTDELIKIIWNPESPLAVDNDCQCQMGQGEIRSPFSCAQCKNLRRLIDFRMGGVDRPFELECGTQAGKVLIVTKSEISNTFLNVDFDAQRRARMYVQQYHSLTMCGTPDVSDMKCISGDRFTIRTLIIFMLDKIFRDKRLPHIPHMHTAFICRDVGYSVFDNPSIGTISELHKIAEYHDTATTALTALKASITKSLILQLLVIFSELSNVNFSHGTPSIHGLIFTKDPVSYAYDGVTVAGPITLQITDLTNASATFNNTHYYAKNVQDSLYESMFVPDIQTKRAAMAHCHALGVVDKIQPISCPSTLATCPDATTYDVCNTQNALFYRLTANTMTVYNAIRHIGFPLYVGSFDFYAFMVALMCDKPFYLSVLQNPELYRLWSMMWLTEDITNVETKIREYHGIAETGDYNKRAQAGFVVDIIRGAWLRCDIVKYMWSLMKRGW